KTAHEEEVRRALRTNVRKDRLAYDRVNGILENVISHGLLLKSYNPRDRDGVRRTLVDRRESCAVQHRARRCGIEDACFGHCTRALTCTERRRIGHSVATDHS